MTGRGYDRPANHIFAAYSKAPQVMPAYTRVDFGRKRLFIQPSQAWLGKHHLGPFESTKEGGRSVCAQLNPIAEGALR